MFNTQALLEEEGATPDQGSGAPVGLGAFDFRTHRSAQIGKLGEDAHEVCAAASLGCIAVQPCRTFALMTFRIVFIAYIAGTGLVALHLVRHSMPCFKSA